MSHLQPDVSVIVPVYQRADLLVEAVGSVAASAGDLAFETIVVDDGSAISIEPIASTLPVRFHRLDRNAGSSMARNAGIGLARGRYLKFLDSDDVLSAGALSAEVEAADATHADIVVSGWREVDYRPGHGSVVQSVRNAPTFEVIEDDLLAGKGVPTSAALYRSSTVASVRWDPALAKLNDWDYFVHSALASRRITTVSGHAYDWRSHPGERITTMSPVDRELREFYQILLRMIGAIESRGSLTHARRRRAAQFLYKELRRQYVRDRPVARETLGRIRELDPEFVPTVEEPSVLFRLAGRLRLLGPALEAYAWLAAGRHRR